MKVDPNFQEIHRITEEIVAQARQNPDLAQWIIFAASSLAAAACASDPDNPARSLKNHLAWYRENTTAAFNRFKKGRVRHGKFDA